MQRVGKPDGRWPRLKWKDYRDAAPALEAWRDRVAEEAYRFLEENPDDPFFFSATGDSFVVALRCGDEIWVMDTVVMREAYHFTKGE